MKTEEEWFIFKFSRQWSYGDTALVAGRKQKANFKSLIALI